MIDISNCKHKFLPTREWCFLLEMLINLLPQIVRSGVQCQFEIRWLRCCAKESPERGSRGTKEALKVQTFLTSWGISDFIVGNNELLTGCVRKKIPKTRLTVYIFISTSDGDSLGTGFALYCGVAVGKILLITLVFWSLYSCVCQICNHVNTLETASPTGETAFFPSFLYTNQYIILIYLLQ